MSLELKSKMMGKIKELEGKVVQNWGLPTGSPMIKESFNTPSFFFKCMYLLGWSCSRNHIDAAS